MNADTDRNSAVVFHIPHAATVIPDDLRNTLVLSEAHLQAELARMTDHFTDALVSTALPQAVRVTFPVSRLVVDPERFACDNDESMSRIGMGAVYLKTSMGKALRSPLGHTERQSLMERFYHPHHRQLTAAVDAALGKHDRCLILDIHSFPSYPLPYEPHQDTDRPDICLGTDAFHTPPALASSFRTMFERTGFRVHFDSPFAGSMVPSQFYGVDVRVSSLMIEVNRRLYMDESTCQRLPKFGSVRDQIGKAIENAVNAMI